jgi:acyl carrier protein
MTDDQRIYEVLDDIFHEVFQCPVTLRAELRADDVTGWDSLKQIMIIVEMERRFGIRLSSRETDAIKCVGDLVRLVLNKVS